MNDVLSQFLNKNSARAREYKDVIETMLNGEDYQYAYDTLTGILEWIEQNDSVTDAQIEAINNIRDNPSEDFYGRR